MEIAELGMSCFVDPGNEGVRQIYSALPPISGVPIRSRYVSCLFHPTTSRAGARFEEPERRLELAWRSRSVGFCGAGGLPNRLIVDNILLHGSHGDIYLQVDRVILQNPLA